jgi:lipoic acid synthetase
MVGLVKIGLEVHQVMDDMRSADIDFLTMGQYLQPTQRHARSRSSSPRTRSAPTQRSRAPKGSCWWPPLHLTRSSYHAGDDFAKLKGRPRGQVGYHTRA